MAIRDGKNSNWITAHSKVTATWLSDWRALLVMDSGGLSPPCYVMAVQLKINHFSRGFCTLDRQVFVFYQRKPVGECDLIGV